MKRQIVRRLGSLAAAILLLVGLAGADLAPLVQTAQAVTQADIDKLKQEAKDLAKNRKELKSELADLKNDRHQLLKHQALLDQQIALTEHEIENTEAQIAGYDALLAQSELELQENEEAEALQYQRFCQRTRAMEENGEPSYWSALLGASSFSDLLSRITDVQEIMAYDERMLEELRTLREEIQEKKAEQEALRQEAEDVKVQLETKKEELKAQREEARQMVKDLEANLEEYNRQLREIEEEEEQIQKDIVKKSDELAEQMGWNATVGGYIWPVTKSRRITSPYGPRNTGIKGASRMHKGVDIGGVGYDTKILAAKDGIVVTSKHSSSYGNYVVISHGKGNTTLYAHMSSRKVKEGDVVTQGQVIGISGSTGISNGPHLHYEITENGKRVNPIQYLPGWIKAY